MCIFYIILYCALLYLYVSAYFTKYRLKNNGRCYLTQIRMTRQRTIKRHFCYAYANTSFENICRHNWFLSSFIHKCFERRRQFIKIQILNKLLFFSLWIKKDMRVWQMEKKYCSYINIINIIYINIILMFSNEPQWATFNTMKMRTWCNDLL